MDNQTKDNVQLFVMISSYILLATLGIYTPIVFVIFPILNLPMLCYLTKTNHKTYHHLIAQGIITGAIFMITGSFEQALLYLIFIAGSSYLMTYFYKKDFSLPHTFIYTGVILVGLFFLYTVGMKYVGIDYIGEYMQTLDWYEQTLIQQVNELAQLNSSISNHIELFTTSVKVQMEMMRLLYPAMFLTMGIGFAFINMFFFSRINKIRKVPNRSLREIGHFRFSPRMVILLIAGLSMFMVDRDLVFILASNLVLLSTALFQFTGFVTLIVFIKRSRATKAIKVLVGIVTVFAFYLFPIPVMLVGIIDTLLNLKKSEIVV